MIEVAQPKILLNDVPLLRDLVVPLDLYLRYLRPSRILPHDL